MRGHIKQRSKGSYTIVIDLGCDPSSGKRKQQWTTVKGTKKQAEQRLAELLNQLNTGTYVKPAKITLGQFLEQWLSDYVDTNVRPRTAEGYRIIGGTVNRCVNRDQAAAT